ncbi:ParE family toxin-like protein [Pseudoalteromonas distincta]|uniref:ParE family toxin-like protein n=1 Tax=Pseudoalteromonas distincta TaxID=77608 RepID=UPI003F9D6AAC
MESMNCLFKTFPKCKSGRYLSEAKKIYNHLLQGRNYRDIGGRKLTIAPNLIRFKLGNYRLIFIFRNGNFQPKALLARKNLESYLKRR